MSEEIKKPCGNLPLCYAVHFKSLTEWFPKRWNLEGRNRLQ